VYNKLLSIFSTRIRAVVQAELQQQLSTKARVLRARFDGMLAELTSGVKAEPEPEPEPEPALRTPRLTTEL
jgi:hypothetical protein